MSGGGEKKLHKARELAQKLAPMVLWIDEIEKAFASPGSSGEADAGLSQRLLATSNDITVLPPEMVRKGRFDEIFFVDLPNIEVRAALFGLHLKKRGRDATSFDLAKLAAGSNGFSGAEIEQAIVHGVCTEATTHDRDSSSGNSRDAAAQRNSGGGSRIHPSMGQDSRRARRLRKQSGASTICRTFQFSIDQRLRHLAGTGCRRGPQLGTSLSRRCVLRDRR